MIKGEHKSTEIKTKLKMFIDSDLSSSRYNVTFLLSYEKFHECLAFSQNNKYDRESGKGEKIYIIDIYITGREISGCVTYLCKMETSAERERRER